jgi:hypothetical protein
MVISKIPPQFGTIASYLGVPDIPWYSDLRKGAIGTNSHLQSTILLRNCLTEIACGQDSPSFWIDASSASRSSAPNRRQKQQLLAASWEIAIVINPSYSCETCRHHLYTSNLGERIWKAASRSPLTQKEQEKILLQALYIAKRTDNTRQTPKYMLRIHLCLFEA